MRLVRVFAAVLLALAALPGALQAQTWPARPLGLIAAVPGGIVIAALNTPERVERLRDVGAEPNRMTRTEYTAMIAADIARWGEIVRSANIQAD